MTCVNGFINFYQEQNCPRGVGNTPFDSKEVSATLLLIVGSQAVCVPLSVYSLLFNLKDDLPRPDCSASKRV